MNSPVPKQFLSIAGLPVLMHSIRAFQLAEPGIKIIVALPPESYRQWQDLCLSHVFRIPHQLSPGGPTRYDSVKNALSFVPAEGLVAIHDAVRPLASKELIQTAFREAEVHGSAIPCVPVRDSVRILEGENSSILDRNLLRIIQTPQAFRASLILRAYAGTASGTFTDDAGVAEQAGSTVHLIEGDPDNIKITYPADLVIAEAILSGRKPTPR